MAIEVSEVRSETQVPATIISDADVEYAIDKVGANGLESVCVYVLRMVLRKYRGRYRIRIGNVWESINPNELRSLIKEFEARGGSVLKDDVEEPDSWFTRSGL